MDTLARTCIFFMDMLWRTQKSNNWWERAALSEPSIHWKQVWLTYGWQYKPCSCYSYRELKQPLAVEDHGTDTHGVPPTGYHEGRMPFPRNKTHHDLLANSHGPSNTLEGIELVHCSATGMKTALFLLDPEFTDGHPYARIWSLLWISCD